MPRHLTRGQSARLAAYLPASPPLWHGTAQGSAATEEEIEMKYAPLAKRKRKSKAGPVLGAAGLSLTLASGASAANTGPVQDTLTGCFPANYVHGLEHVTLPPDDDPLRWPPELPTRLPSIYRH